MIVIVFVPDVTMDVVVFVVLEYSVAPLIVLSPYSSENVFGVDALKFTVILLPVPVSNAVTEREKFQIYLQM